MSILPHFIHYTTIAAILAVTTFSVSLGQGKICKAALKALNLQPSARSDISTTLLLALALIETAALLSLMGSLLLFFGKPTITLYSAIAQLGITAALLFPGASLGIAGALPAQGALLAIARQPFIAKKISNLMLLTQSLIQTPLIFGFIIALIINYRLATVTSLPQALVLLASGLCIGIASIGPILGVGKFTQAACVSIGLNKTAYNKLLSFTIISQAIIETPVIFASIISFWLLNIAGTEIANPLASLVYLAVAGVMAVGTFGPGLSSGITAAAACKEIAYHPEHSSILSRASMLAQGLIDTSAIYAFIIALSLIITPL